jgi:hypothetical protein
MGMEKKSSEEIKEMSTKEAMEYIHEQTKELVQKTKKKCADNK